jgi:hypothetical protein
MNHYEPEYRRRSPARLSTLKELYQAIPDDRQWSADRPGGSTNSSLSFANTMATRLFTLQRMVPRSETCRMRACGSTTQNGSPFCATT